MITLQNVSKKYGEQLAVDDLNLNIKRGELCVLLGKSGCGKSTTLRMINRLIEPTLGEIYLDGKKVQDYNIEKFRWNIGYAVQNVGLFPHMTVENNIAVVPQMLKWDKKKIRNRVEKMLDLVGLDVDRYIHKHPTQLSGGEAQRIGVARALAADPEVVLMDEPFGAVDPINRARLQLEFGKIQKKLQKTVVFVTHDIEEAIRLADKIAIMEKGVLKAYDTPQNILISDKTGFVKEFVGKDYLLKLLSRYTVGDYLKPISQIQNTSKCTVSQLDSFQVALTCMIQESVTEISVIDETGNVVGMLSLDNICHILKEA